MFTTVLTTTLHHSHHHRTCLQTNRRCWIEILEIPPKKCNPLKPLFGFPDSSPSHCRSTTMDLWKCLWNRYISPNHCFYITENFILNLPRQKWKSGMRFLGIFLLGKIWFVRSSNCWKKRSASKMGFLPDKLYKLVKKTRPQTKMCENETTWG